MIANFIKIGQGVFELQGSENRGLPLTWPIALTTVQHYRADCDSVHDTRTRYLLTHFIVLKFSFSYWSGGTSTTAISYANHHKHDSITTAPETVIFYIWIYPITPSWCGVMFLILAIFVVNKASTHTISTSIYLLLRLSRINAIGGPFAAVAPIINLR